MGTPRGWQDHGPAHWREDGGRWQGRPVPRSVFMLPFLGSSNPKGTLSQPWAVLTLGVAVAEGGGAHVAQPDGAFAAAVDKGVAVVRVELGGRDHLRQLLHVGRFDVHDVWQGESRSPPQPDADPAPPAAPPADVPGSRASPRPVQVGVPGRAAPSRGSTAAPSRDQAAPVLGKANICHVFHSAADHSSGTAAWSCPARHKT